MDNFTEWTDRAGVALAPWQADLGQRIIDALDNGERVVLNYGRKGGWITLGKALSDYEDDRR